MTLVRKGNGAHSSVIMINCIEHCSYISIVHTAFILATNDLYEADASARMQLRVIVHGSWARAGIFILSDARGLVLFPGYAI